MIKKIFRKTILFFRRKRKRFMKKTRRKLRRKAKWMAKKSIKKAIKIKLMSITGGLFK